MFENIQKLGFGLEEGLLWKDENPIHYFYTQGVMMLLLTLIECGCNIEEPIAKHNGKTALHVAADSGRVEIVKALMECGANVNEKGWGIGQNVTPIISASYNPEVIKILVGGGADTIFGPTAIEKAFKGNRFR